VQRIDEITETPIIGRFYLVPCVEVTAEHVKQGCSGMLTGWWPVYGPEHEDTKFFDFPHRHWHYDARFLSDRQLSNRGQHSTRRGTEVVLALPLTNHGELRPPALRRKQCRRPVPEWQQTLPGLPKLERVIKAEGRTLRGNCKVCPHRGFPLASLPVMPDGSVTCPGHGLRWHAETGALVQRNAHQPVRSPLLAPRARPSAPQIQVGGWQEADDRSGACARLERRRRA
jgi:nitrite reductase/ring-hydroxylating ferredoxin subunit